MTDDASARTLQTIALDFSNIEWVQRPEVNEGDELEPESFLHAMEGIASVFHAMGGGFTFVQNDVTKKVAFLRSLGGKVMNEAFSTLHEMVRIEIKHKRTHSGKKDPNGTRMLLRLRWTIEFVRMLVDMMSENPEKELKPCAQESYAAKLAHHHPWAVRKIVGVAMHALPYRKDFLRSLGLEDSPSGWETLRNLGAALAPLEANLLAFMGLHNLEGVP